MLHVITYSLLALILIIAAVMDCRTRKIDNRLTCGAIGFGVVWWGVVSISSGHGFQGLAASLLGLTAGFVPFVFFYKMGGLGGGDVKLMGAVGALTASWQVVLSTALYAFVVGMLIGIVLMFRHRIVKRTMVRLFCAGLSLAG